MILRDPGERAFSQYLHAVTLGAIHKSFRQQIRASLGARDKTFGKLYPFLEFGLYYEQVKRYLDLFPAENIRIYVYEDYRDKPLEMLADLFRFLEVDAGFTADTSQRRLEPRIPRFPRMAHFFNRFGPGRRIKEFSPNLIPFLRPLVFRSRKSLAMDPEDRTYLRGYYEEDVQKLSGLLNRDLRRVWNC